MSEPAHDAPPGIGGTKSFTGGTSGAVFQLFRPDQDLMEVRRDDDPAYLGRVIMEGNLYHLSGDDNADGPVQRTWDELIESL